MPLVLNGATSGSTTVTPTDAVTVSLTLPSTGGTLQTSGSGYTTNGVAYATSTSALATGSSLVWTGSSLGVGTSSPSGTLHVEGPYASNYVRIASGSDNNLLLGSGNAIITGAGSTDVGIRSSAAMLFASGGGTERMRLTSAGMLLLGTTASDTVAGMTIAGSVSGTDITTAYNNSLFAIKNTDRTTNNLTVMYFDGLSSGGSVRGLGAIGMQVTSWTDGAINSNMLFWNSNSGIVAERMRIDTSGNLLIGGTSAASGAQGLQVNLAGTAGNQIGFSSQGNSNGQTIWTNTNTGNWRLTFAFGGTNIGTYGAIQFDNAGNAYKASGAGSWLATSDIRIKTNIELVTDGLTRILELKPRTFDYKQPEAHQGKVHDKGFIADEYELVYPNSVIDSELVNDLDRQYTSDDKTLKAMSFNAEFYADLVSSIQELSAELNALKAKVGA